MTIKMIHTQIEESMETGMKDEQARSIRFCSVNDQSFRFSDHPSSFEEQGKVFANGETGSVRVDVSYIDLFFTGDGMGEKWLADKAAAA